jgi:SAM-dependent methyltransferase
VRTQLRESRYEPGPIQELLHTPGILLFSAIDIPVHERRLAGDESALATLIRLFLVDLPVEHDVAERGLGDVLRSLEALGFVLEEQGELRGVLRIVPFEGLLIASDNPRVDAGADHVAGVHGPSGALASMTVRRPVGRALDVGTGNGVQALLLAAHAERVVATDINERALAFAALNAALNGIDNVEFRAGSFLEPVEGERFDLVVANPPYVISPESEYIFRDSGLGRDRVSESLVRALPAVLEDGAFATVLVSWITAGNDSVDAPRGWLDGSGCDAWLFRSGLEDPLSAATS